MIDFSGVAKLAIVGLLAIAIALLAAPFVLWWAWHHITIGIK